jgi:hypothetical protein
MANLIFTPSALAVQLLTMTANLIGAVYVRKPMKLRKTSEFDRKVKLADQIDELFGGALFKVYSIVSMQTLNNFENSVNNAKLRNGFDADYEMGERQWGRHWMQSPLVIVNNGGDRFYLHIRTNSNSSYKSAWIDANGNEHDYETVEPFLLSGDRKEAKERSRQATAERQGLSEDEAVFPFDIPLDTITELAYGGNRITVVGEPSGACAEIVSEYAEREQEMRDA